MNGFDAALMDESRSRFESPWRDGTTQLVMSPLE
jgi:hypothetical protein